MDPLREMDENQRQFDSGKINESEYNKQRESILNRLVAGQNESKKTDSRVGSKPKETDLYAILQLNPNATEAEIKSNYKRLALKHHPDRNGGVETEEWNKLLKAYQILSDTNSRYLYDNYGTINNSLEGKASLNHYVGGDSWEPYIGNLEIGLWLFSFMDNESSPELENINTAEQKKHRHTIRVSNIVRYLQDKLTRFPKQDDPSELKSFAGGGLRQEALKLSVEPNGKELLSFLGEIYISKAQAHLNAATSIECSGPFSNFWFMVGLVSGFLAGIFSNFGFMADLVSGFLEVKSKGGQLMSQDEISKVIWRLSRSEISSIARETCDKVLTDKSHDDLDRSYHLANSLLILGEFWLEVSKQSGI